MAIFYKLGLRDGHKEESDNAAQERAAAEGEHGVEPRRRADVYRHVIQVRPRQVPDHKGEERVLRPRSVN